MSHKVDQPADSWTSINHQMAKFTHRFEFDNFNFFPKCTDCTKEGLKEADDHQEIFSPKFSPPNDPTLQFHLALFPKGKTEDEKGHVSLFLHLFSCPKPDVRVQCKMSIIDRQNMKQNTVDFLAKLSPIKPNIGFGYPKFITHEKLDSLLTNGKLVIFCEIKALVDTINTTGSFGQDSQIECQALDNYSKLLESSKLSDVVLVAGDLVKSEHRAHRAILAARSPVFGAMFEHDTTERNRGRVLIEDIDGDVIERMLRFIYTGKVPKLDQLADKLLIAADKYELDQLKDICEKYLVANLCTETVLSLLVIADRHSAPLLRSKSIEFINSNLPSLVETENWKAIEDSPKLYFELFSKIIVENIKI